LRYETFYYKEIISKLPKVELDKIGEAVGADYRVSKLTGENILNLLLYSILEKNELSLRMYCMYIFRANKSSNKKVTIELESLLHQEIVFLMISESFLSILINFLWTGVQVSIEK